jgi:RNA polymerase sigma-70 factor (ECF subfamily)
MAAHLKAARSTAQMDEGRGNYSQAARSTAQMDEGRGNYSQAARSTAQMDEGRGNCSPRELDRTGLGDHIDRLYRAAWALCGSREEAEDLVQETFVRVMARPRLLRREDDLGYLLRALRNTFLTGLRTARRRPTLESLDLRLELIEDNGARTPDRAAEAREVYAAIAALPPKCRDALVGVDVIGLSYRETARALRIRPETVTSRLFRARKLVAAQLGDTQPAAMPAHRAEPRSARDQLDQAAAAHAAR